ncbi:MAG: rhodanese-like domain-containing protein [Candidatus Izemoplasma sp.]|nr:rhodanese-like domain-containing protein [Candidatus Izemoplasma sp.]
MDWIDIVLAIALGLGFGWLLMRYQNLDRSKLHIIDQETFENNMRKGQLIDVRKKDAYDKDKIKGARNFKKSQIVGKYSRLRKDQSVYIYCQNGRKSKRLAKKMIRDGFSDIYILEGGFNNYTHQ